MMKRGCNVLVAMLVLCLSIFLLSIEALAVEETDLKLNYVYIDQSYIEPQDMQSIVVSLEKSGGNITNMELVLENSNKIETTLSPESQADGVFLFQESFDKGIYHVKELNVFTDSDKKEFSADEMGVDAYFGVGQEYSGNDKSNHVEMESAIGTGNADMVEASTAAVDEDGDNAESNIENALMTARSVIPSTTAATKNKGLVLVLDPGHDTGHVGARGNDIKEEEATLKIARYCKAELEKYEGVSVYLTRNEECPYPETVGKKSGNILDIQNRVQAADEKGADAFISFHLNSWTTSSANGAEVYYHKSNPIGKNLAQKVQDELKKLGLYNRGVKNNEAFAVIKTAQSKGFPGIIIEHAFVTNKNDASSYLNSSTKLKRLGAADAAGIAKHYDLKKKSAGPALEISSVAARSIRLEWGEVSNAIGYEVYKKQSDGSYKMIGETEGSTAVTYTDESLKPATTYTYKVRAKIDNSGEVAYGPYSSAVSETTRLDGTKINKTSASDTSVNLSWEKVPYASGYAVYRYTSSKKAYVKVQTVSASKLSCIDTGLKSNITFQYKVRAYKKVGSTTVYGAYSPVVKVKTKVGAPLKVGRTTVKLKASSFDKMKITWKKVSGASGYQIQRYNPSTKKYATVKTITKGSTVSYTNGSLDAGTTYKYRVRAYKKSGSKKVYGSWSTVKSAKTKGSRNAKIKASGVNARKGASTSYKSIKKLNKGAKVRVIGSRGGWYKVSFKISKKTTKAYILKKYVKLN